MATSRMSLGAHPLPTRARAAGILAARLGVLVWYLANTNLSHFLAGVLVGPGATIALAGWKRCTPGSAVSFMV